MTTWRRIAHHPGAVILLGPLDPGSDVGEMEQARCGLCNAPAYGGVRDDVQQLRRGVVPVVSWPGGAAPPRWLFGDVPDAVQLIACYRCGRRTECVPPSALARVRGWVQHNRRALVQRGGFATFTGSEVLDDDRKKPAA